MSNEPFLKNLPPIEEIYQSGLKMLVIIVNRADGDKATKFLRQKNFHFQFTCMAEGTHGSEILDLLGLGTVDKTMVFCISSGSRIKQVLTEALESLHLAKAGKGIAFTIPLAGISLLAALSPEKKEHLEHWLKDMENEVDKMNDSITHSIVIALVNHGYSEQVVEAAKEVGATGGTVINARRTGTDEAVKFFALSIQAEKEIVAILTKREGKQIIMDTINKGFGTDSPARGIVLSLPVDGVAGIRSL